MNAEEQKRLAAQQAVRYVEEGSVVGVGTGSTVAHFIDELGKIRGRIEATVSSSEKSTALLKQLGIPVVDLNSVGELALYVDGADECDPHKCLIKGGGAALTREKIVADLAERFVCIADGSKLVARLGRFPLPVEVIAMAAAQVTRRFAAIGGRAQRREGVVTDNGGLILDVHGLAIADPVALETEVNQWPGVVCVGIFARRRATVCLLGTAEGVRTLTF